jgi:sortase B
MSKNKKKKRGVGDVILTILLIFAIAVFCFAAYKLFTIYQEYKAGTDEYNEIAQMAVTEVDESADTEEKKESELVDMEPTEKKTQIQAPISVDFAALQAVNEDVIGWLYVEALSDTINYPVVHGKDNEQYLHTTYYCNTLVYGHNMKNGSMFGLLKRFVQNEQTYKDSKYFWILTPTKNYRYEIIAAYTTGVYSDTYTLFSGPGEAFESYLQKIVTKSEIQTTPGTLTQEDHIVTLSTCTGNSSTRFVVQGKRVDEADVQQ